MSVKERLRRMLPSAVRPRRILAGPLRGNYLVTSWHDYPAALLGYAESGLLDWFAENVHPGETWLDLGAHYGYISLALCRHVGKSGRVFAFEPLLHTAGHLSATRQANRLEQLTVVPLALADNPDIVVVNAQVCKAMAQPLGALSGGGWVEPIYCVALDSLWAGLCDGDETISGIKMDVEGMEGRALEGMIGLLRKHTPRLIVEVHRSRGVELEALAPTLREAGYRTPGRLIGKVTSTDASYEFLVEEDRSFLSQPPWQKQTSVATFVGK